MVGSKLFGNFNLKRIRQILRSELLGAGLLLIFIVNNNNIWADSRRYRKRPKLEM